MRNVCNLLLCLGLVSLSPLLAAPIRVGVQLSLSGDLAPLGTDQQHALQFISEKLGGGRYEFIVEDDQCANVRAVSIARKFIEVDKVQFVFGMTCNQTLMATAPVYDRAGMTVISTSATSGDVANIGKNIFRFFPSDRFGAERLYQYLKTRHKHLAVVTEQTEYAIMMERSLSHLNEKDNSPLKISSYPFLHSNADFRSLLTKIKSSGADAVYLNSDSDASFVTLLKQCHAIAVRAPLYGVYLGASATVQKEVPQLVEGLVFSNLPTLDQFVSNSGKEVLQQFRKKFGEPLSGYPVVPPTMEAFRIFDKAITSGTPLSELLRDAEIRDGILPPYGMDPDGNINGLKFQMQKVENGKVVVLED